MVLFTIRYSVTMKKSLVGLLSALLLILAPTAQGQVKNQEIQGSVVEFGVEAAVPNAVISLASGGKVLATTDAQGRFRITAAAGVNLRVRALGYTDMVVAARDGMRVALARRLRSSTKSSWLVLVRKKRATSPDPLLR